MDIIPILLLATVILAAGFATFSLWKGGRYATLSIALNLRDGEKYARKLDKLIGEIDYASPNGRASAIARIAATVKEEDVTDGYVTIRDFHSSKDAAGVKAEETARHLMQYIGITPEAVNIAEPDGSGVHIDHKQKTGKGAPENAEACILALVITIRRGALGGHEEGGQQHAVRSLAILSRTPGEEMDALYFFYAPNSGESLDPTTANRIFLDLRAAAHAPDSSP